MGNKVLIAGATGMVGHAALVYFSASPDWDVVAVSRRVPDCAAPFEHIAVDLTDEKACRDVFGRRSDITHVIYAALHDRVQPDAEWPGTDSVSANLSMLRNLLEPLRKSSTQLHHVTTLQGTKAYGVHVGQQIPVPAKERWPRFEHKNFYWQQEDYIREAQQSQSWHWTIFRPQIIFGYSIGSPMNHIPVIGVLAAICREENLPMGFPGRSSSILEAIDARLLARAFEWAAIADTSHNQIFNITNGDVFVWRNVWPTIANTLGTEAGPDNPLSVREFLQEKESTWEDIVRKYKLRPLNLRDLIGQSGAHADMGFRYGTNQSQSALVSTIKLRQSGFHACMDTEDAFQDWFRFYEQQRVLPPVLLDKG